MGKKWHVTKDLKRVAFESAKHALMDSVKHLRLIETEEEE
jgi:hypothetical protein